MVSKKESLQLKGCAILFMVFLHLFNQKANVDLCAHFLYFMGEPLVAQMAKFTACCVSFYLFLSGYGLFISYQRNPDLKPWKRIKKLYQRFWLIFLIFIPLGSWLRPDKYPGSIRTFIQNVTGWDTSYNGEWWFLFPYILLVLTAVVIFRILEKYSWKVIIPVNCLLFALVYLTMRMYRPYLYTNQLINMPLLYLSCLSSFVWGALFALYDFGGWIKERIRLHTPTLQFLWGLMFFALLFLRIITPVAALNFAFMLLFVCWFLPLRKAPWAEKLLEKLGAQSTNMWLVHSFLCYYLFHDFIYGFRYPLLIFFVTVGLSYGIGMLIDRLYALIFLRDAEKA